MVASIPNELNALARPAYTQAMEHPSSAPNGPLPGSASGPVPCPRCGEPLGNPDMGSEVQLSGRPCNGPHGCGGVWYRHATFDLLKKQAKEAGQLDLDADHSPSAAFPGPAGAPKIQCPECTEPMVQRHFRFEGRATPIVLDDCAAHGIWFDVDEFEAAMQVVRAHAQALARHRERARLPKAPEASQSSQQRTSMSPGPAEFAKQQRASGKGKRAKNSSSGAEVAAEATEFFADVALGALFAVFFD